MNEFSELIKDSSLAVWEEYEAKAGAVLMRLGRAKRFGGRVVRTSTAAVAVGVGVAVLLVVAAALCVGLSALTTGFIRYYLLRGIQPHQFFDLDINALPLFTDDWRGRFMEERMGPLVQPSASVLAATLDGATTSAALETGRWPSPAVSEVQLDLLRQQAQSIVATMTLLFPSVLRNDIFLPGGGVAYEGLFRQGPPLFNARGVYSGELELTFLKNNGKSRKDSSVVVEAAMLFAEEGTVPQAVHTLDVLFRKVVSTPIEDGAGSSSWMVIRLLVAAWRVAFFPLRWFTWQLQKLPVFGGRYSPFSAGGGSGGWTSSFGEDSVGRIALPLYSSFSPPLSFQPRIRAMNFTVYNIHGRGGSVPAPPLRLLSARFHSMLETEGVVYLLTQFPLTSTIVVASLLCTGYACVFLFGAVALVVVVVVVQVRRGRQTDDDDDDTFLYHQGETLGEPDGGAMAREEDDWQFYEE